MELMIKVFKWSLCATFFVIGAGFLWATNMTGSVKPIFVSILSFGILYWLSQAFFGKTKVLLGMTIAVLAVSCFCSLYFYHGFDFLSGWHGYDLFFEWALWCYAIGIPVMTISFKKWD